MRRCDVIVGKWLRHVLVNLSVIGIHDVEHGRIHESSKTCDMENPLQLNGDVLEELGEVNQ